MTEEHATAAEPPVRTLALDIGGTGLKAALIGEDGALISDRQRVATSYPMPPERMVAALVELAAPLRPFDRASAGFPGVVRAGRVRTAPHFITSHGPGSDIDPELVELWRDFDLAAALSAALGVETRAANDADLQGAAVIAGVGLELVLTLGTGLGSALYRDGRLACHLELAHHPFQKGKSYNERIGEAARGEVGTRRWSKRVRAALRAIDALLLPDRIWLGGGNAGNVTGGYGDAAERVTVIDNSAGLAGGVALWGRDLQLEGAAPVRAVPARAVPGSAVPGSAVPPGAPGAPGSPGPR